MQKRGRLIAGVLIVGLVLFVLLRQFGGGDDDVVLRSRTALVAAGDCIDLPRDDAELLEPIDCAEPHDAQVFAEFDLDDGPYPGAGVVTEQADAGCVDRWGRAVGTNYFTDLTFDFVTVTPDEARWEDGVREVACILVAAEGTPMVRDQLRG